MLEKHHDKTFNWKLCEAPWTWFINNATFLKVVHEIPHKEGYKLWVNVYCAPGSFPSFRVITQEEASKKFYIQAPLINKWYSTEQSSKLI